ncbi:MAG: zeta toxin family protein [Alphaproteobacteria bacterium]|jgi:predicted ABC-type ATPase|nr:zeta toxin family protein [Alphaproteobacteria bacterium]
MTKYQLWIVAGPNGSGKSTLVAKYLPIFKDRIELINPDNIARELAEDPRYPSLAVQLQAGKEVLLKQKSMLENKQSFIIETTFSGKHEINLQKQAQELGYKTNLVFIGINNVLGNINRVETRVQQGGHFVSVEDITRRYTRSFENLKNNYQNFDRAFIFDNSYKTNILKLSLEDNNIKFQAKDLPNWVVNSISL